MRRLTIVVCFQALQRLESAHGDGSEVIMVYFDYNATAPPAEGLIPYLSDTLGRALANPSSVHRSGRDARAEVERARRRVAASMNAEPGELTFTSGATEAIHLGLSNLLKAGDDVLVSPVEHPAVYGALDVIGASWRTFEVECSGAIHLSTILDAMTEATRLVILMAAQNETGNLYPIQALASELGPVPLFSDCVQMYGKYPMDMVELGVAGAAFSGHKVGGLAGVGVLWMPRGTTVEAALKGGAQERGRRGGTENISGIISFGHAATLIDKRCQDTGRIEKYRDAIEATLSRAVPGFIVHGAGEKRLANTLNFRINGVPGDLLLQALDLEGFQVSTGSACSAGSVEASPALKAMGLTELEAKEGVRVSLGPENDWPEVERFIELVPDLVERIKAHYRSEVD
ncbi:MAG: cysteine desulfurase family protein [Myxococcota bacterium]|nr:cysteine desulfurase family protein [Myxococcota bacterium]